MDQMYNPSEWLYSMNYQGSWVNKKHACIPSYRIIGHSGRMASSSATALAELGFSRTQIVLTKSHFDCKPRFSRIAIRWWRMAACRHFIWWYKGEDGFCDSEFGWYWTWFGATLCVEEHVAKEPVNLSLSPSYGLFIGLHHLISLFI